MPTLVDYQTVLDLLTNSGLTCNYHRSGSFGLKKPSATVGWVNEPDATIRPEMLAHVRIAPLNIMVSHLECVWAERLAGDLWIMPASHWAYELTYGNADWLPERLSSIGIDAAELQERNDGSAIAFTLAEAKHARLLIADLLSRSIGSDFTAAWPGHATVAMLHHHQQIWWTTADDTLARTLESIK